MFIHNPKFPARSRGLLSKTVCPPPKNDEGEDDTDNGKFFHDLSSTVFVLIISTAVLNNE
jgi:hypothetical protein